MLRASAPQRGEPNAHRSRARSLSIPARPAIGAATVSRRRGNRGRRSSTFQDRIGTSLLACPVVQATRLAGRYNRPLRSLLSSGLASVSAHATGGPRCGAITGLDRAHEPAKDTQVNDTSTTSPHRQSKPRRCAAPAVFRWRSVKAGRLALRRKAEDSVGTLLSGLLRRTLHQRPVPPADDGGFMLWAADAMTASPARSTG